MSIRDLKIGDVVYIHNETKRIVYDLVIQEIKKYNNDYSLHGVNKKGSVVIPSTSLKQVFFTKEEALESYLIAMNKEIIETIKSVN